MRILTSSMTEDLYILNPNTRILEILKDNEWVVSWNDDFDKFATISRLVFLRFLTTSSFFSPNQKILKNLYQQKRKKIPLPYIQPVRTTTILSSLCNIQ